MKVLHIDLASLVGLILGFVMVIVGIITSGGVNTLINFVDVASIVVTVGGSIAGLIGSYTFKEFVTHLKGFGIAFKDPKLDNAATIRKIIELSNVARKDGLLALEEVAQ